MSVKSDIPLAIDDIKIPPLRLKESNEISIKIYTPRAVHTDSMISPLSYLKPIKSGEDSAKSMIMDLNFMRPQKRKRANRSSEHNSSHSKKGVDVIHIK
jgi:hypothetical protein